jgi:lysozyme
MKPTQRAYDFIAKEEGLRLEAYQDEAGIWTIGYGIIEYADGRTVHKGDVINKDQADEMLRYQIDSKAKKVDVLTTGLRLMSYQFDALVSFAYNNGVGALAESTLLKTIKANPNGYKTIPVEQMQEDPEVRSWYEKQHIRAVVNITYYFTLWCKITVKDEVTHKPKKILSDSLIRRRLREAQMYLGH